MSMKIWKVSIDKRKSAGTIFSTIVEAKNKATACGIAWSKFENGRDLERKQYRVDAHTVRIHEYFFGNKVSDYGIENLFLDYSTLAKSFQHILNNSIINDIEYLSDWEIASGNIYTDESEEDYKEVFQYWIIDSNGADILQTYLPEEIVFYNTKLDMYVWGVTHYGTSWDYVLTDYSLVEDEE